GILAHVEFAVGGEHVHQRLAVLGHHCVAVARGELADLVLVFEYLQALFDAGHGASPVVGVVVVFVVVVVFCCRCGFCCRCDFCNRESRCQRIRMVSVVAAVSSPIQPPPFWAMPTRAPATWRAPQRPRSWSAISTIWAQPVAPTGWPLATRPPLVLTGM